MISEEKGEVANRTVKITINDTRNERQMLAYKHYQLYSTTSKQDSIKTRHAHYNVTFTTTLI